MPILSHTHANPERYAKKSDAKVEHREDVAFTAIPSFPACLGGSWKLLSPKPFLRAIMRFPEGVILPLHHHPTTACISVLQGQMVIVDIVSNQAYLVAAGQKYVIAARHVHEMRFLTDTKFEFATDSTEMTVYWDFEER
ncbi:hypothetical protein BZG36_02961 [Bifiguratus adelaidae]|uniref:Cupin type-2 domain-containing protein n=1 Tax=Bifiguratus adelaidae TaxID=1938954 RepID=A0A261Y0Y1_9FUNG|nr:hypothetical protein BZG36_02961 [Bifiguratus adelaidae]